MIVGFFALHVLKWHSWAEWEFLHRLENIAYDARLLATMPRTKDERIVILNIDDKSLAVEGRWPWHRDKLARMLDQLFDRYRISVVAFDVVFAEPEETTGLRVIRDLAASELGTDEALRTRLGEMESKLDHDRTFARAIANRSVVLGFFNKKPGDSDAAPVVGTLPDPTFKAGQFKGRNIVFRAAEGFDANLAILQHSAAGAGHASTVPDRDGVVRRVPMLYEYEGAYYGSLSLAVAQVALGVERIEAGFPEASRVGKKYTQMEWLEVGPLRVPVDQHVQALVPYRGPQESFPYVSATDVIQGVVDPPSLLENKIVLVGTTVQGLLDLRATPIAPDFPGVEVHANLISGILGRPGQSDNETALKENPAYTQAAELTLLLVSGLVIAVLLPALSPLWATVTTVSLLAGIIIVNVFVFWQVWNLVFPLATGVVAVLGLFLFNMSYGYLIEERGKRKLAGQFGQYIPPELVEELSENPEAMALRSENKELTVLFSDVRSFTTISEGLDPEELSRLMNEYLTPMTGIIFKHRGTIDKYMGDAIMAFWGAPLDDAEHPRHAMQAAMSMLAELRDIQTRFQDKGWPPIRIGVGINTGKMSVGNMGSQFRRAYTVMGDAVNLGSRLEGLTKTYGVELIVSETTARAVPDYAYRELDRVRVKGKDKPVTIFEPLARREELGGKLKREVELYREALKLYRAENWDMAELQFLNLQKAQPGRPLYGEYLHRIGIFRANPPPPGWDGVFTHESK